MGNKLGYWIKERMHTLFPSLGGNIETESNVKDSDNAQCNEEPLLDTFEERMAYYEEVQRRNPGFHINPHFTRPEFVRLGLPSGTMWEVVTPKETYYPKDDSMLPTIEQAKELLDNCDMQICTDGGSRCIKFESRHNGKILYLSSGVYSDEEPNRVCMTWLKTPVDGNPEWGYALVIGDNGVSFQTFPKSERLYIYLVKIRTSDIH